MSNQAVPCHHFRTANNMHNPRDTIVKCVYKQTCFLALFVLLSKNTHVKLILHNVERERESLERERKREGGEREERERGRERET